jgi:hypothetical protein
MLPIFVSYLAERLRFENPEIIHQNIGFAYALYESSGARSGGEIDGNALDFDLRHVLREPLYRGVDALLGAAIEDHCGTCFGQAERNGEPNARSRPRNDCAFARQVDDHRFVLSMETLQFVSRA